MHFRWIPLAAVAVALIGGIGTVRSEPPSPAAQVTYSIPEQFIPVDTSKLMGSPDPLPLEAVPAFAHLKFERPVELTHAGDGSDRLFVVEQRGVIHVFENRDDVQQAQTFLDIRDVVSREGNEEGLLGLAFHPKYEENGEFFVYYSTKPRASVISRFRVSPDDANRAERSSEERMLVIDQPYANHNGGSIQFGPDGFLYIGLGDGGLANDPHFNGQNLKTLLGSILRIDVDHRDDGLAYAIPKDNPFAGREDARGEIWAYGFRNIWRLAFDRETGQLWAGDVGQHRFEEVDRVERGGNYGWNIREGFHAFNPNAADKPRDLIDPVAEYFRHDGESVTGGVVYRGPSLKNFQGHYFYADYVSGKVWTVPADADQDTVPTQVADTGLEIAAFGEDAAGEMYLCVFDSIYQLRPRAIDLEQVAQEFPRKLSETGLFASVADNLPVEGLIPYEVNVPFWSDYAVKDRHIALPEAESVQFDAQAKWGFPVGTVFVKTFWMHRDRTNLSDPFRLETRLLVHSPQGWVGYTYIYDDQQQDAYLLDGSKVAPLEIKTEAGTITQPYYFPSRSECFACHTKAEEFVLGLTTRQMNRTMAYHGQEVPQLQMLNSLNVFQQPLEPQTRELEALPDWGFGNFDRSGDLEITQTLEPPTGDAEQLARAWLEVNCAMCHRPEGIGPGKIDMRYHAPLGEMALVGQQPGQGRLSPPAGLLIRPGEPLLSELVIRVGHRGTRQMPPLATNLVDQRGLAVIQRWIEQMRAAKEAAE